MSAPERPPAGHRPANRATTTADPGRAPTGPTPTAPATGPASGGRAGGLVPRWRLNAYVLQLTDGREQQL